MLRDTQMSPVRRTDPQAPGPVPVDRVHTRHGLVLRGMDGLEDESSSVIPEESRIVDLAEGTTATPADGAPGPALAVTLRPWQILSLQLD